MKTIVINTVEPSKLEQITAFLNSINVSFEIKKIKKTKEHDPEFGKMVLEASKSKVRIPYNEEYRKKIFQNL